MSLCKHLIGKTAMQALARHAGFANWKLAQQAIAEVVEAVVGFADIARE